MRNALCHAPSPLLSDQSFVNADISYARLDQNPNLYTLQLKLYILHVSNS